MFLPAGSIFLAVVALSTTVESGRVTRDAVTVAVPQIAALFNDAGAYASTCVIVSRSWILCFKPDILTGVTVDVATVTPGGLLTITGPGTFKVTRITPIPDSSHFILIRVCPFMTQTPVTFPQSSPSTGDSVTFYIYENGALESYTTPVVDKADCPVPYDTTTEPDGVLCTQKIADTFDDGAQLFIGSGSSVYVGTYIQGDEIVNSATAEVSTVADAIKYWTGSYNTAAGK